MLTESELGDAKTYELWKGSRPIGKHDELVRVWRSVPKGRDPHVYPGSWVTANPEYLNDYAGRDWQEKTTWVTVEIPADELVDAQTGALPRDTLIFIPKEEKR